MAHRRATVHTRFALPREVRRPWSSRTYREDGNVPVELHLIPGALPAPSLSWRDAGRLVRPMTSEELVAILATTQGSRRVPVDAPITAVVLLAGIEIAVTRRAAERALRKTWRDRRGGGATPLLLLADDSARPGCLVVLGAVDAGGPLRSVDASALGEVLQRL